MSMTKERLLERLGPYGITEFNHASNLRPDLETPFDDDGQYNAGSSRYATPSGSALGKFFATVTPVSYFRWQHGPLVGIDAQISGLPLEPRLTLRAGIATGHDWVPARSSTPIRASVTMTYTRLTEHWGIDLRSPTGKLVHNDERTGAVRASLTSPIRAILDLVMPRHWLDDVEGRVQAEKIHLALASAEEARKKWHAKRDAYLALIAHN